MAGRLAFIVTEDWFFASHFLPMARAARELGLDVDVITRVRHHRDLIEASGARVVPLEAERSSLNPMSAGYAAGQLASVLKALRPDIVHCIALRSILLGGAAAALAGIERRVYALTGLGYLGARTDRVGRLARRAIRFALTGPLRTDRTRFLFENEDDPRLLGLDPADRSHVTIIGGAGIDPDGLHPGVAPSLPPLRVAIVSRMLWSKGIDVAVEAIGLVRERGGNVELSLYGSPDRSNPRSISEARLTEWELAPRHRLAWSDGRRGSGLARAPRCVPALAWWGRITAQPSGSGGLRTADRHDGRRGLPALRARRPGGSSRTARRCDGARGCLQGARGRSRC